MDFRLTEFQQLLKDNAEDFLEREVPATRIREIEEAGEPDAALWKQMVDLGWTGLPIAEEYGGQGGNLADTGILIEEMCRAAMLTPFVNTVIAAAVVQKFGSDDLKKDLLPRIAEGAAAASAVAEESGDIWAETTTTHSGGQVSGKKFFVEYPSASEVHLVTAVDGGTPGIAIVPANQAGISTEDLKSIGSTPQAVVAYNNASADAFISGQEAVDYMRVLGASLASLECYAHMQKSLDMACEYTPMRVQFGRPIGSFEAVQQRVADMGIQVEASKFLSRELLWNIDNDSYDPAQVPVVKAVTAKAVTDVTMWSHVLHGGIGYMQEYDLQFYTRRGKEAALRWGGLRESMTAISDAVLA